MRKGWISATSIVAMSLFVSSALSQEEPGRQPRGRGEARAARGGGPARSAIDSDLKLFELLDADEDGMISKEEFEAGAPVGGRWMRNRDRQRDDAEDRPERPMRGRARLGPPDAEADTLPADRPRQRMRERTEGRHGRPMAPRRGLGRDDDEQGPPAIGRLEQRIRQIVREELARIQTPDKPSAKGAAFSPARRGLRWDTKRGRMDADQPGMRGNDRRGHGWRPRGGRGERLGGVMGPDAGKEGFPRVEAIRQAIRTLERAVDGMETGKISPRTRRGLVEREWVQSCMGRPQRRFGNGPRGGFPREGFQGGPWR